MKKLVALIVALVLALSCTAAFAFVTDYESEEFFVAYQSYSSVYGRLSVAITNTGSDAIRVKDVDFDVLGADDASLYNSTYLSLYPSVIMPGTTAYGYIYPYLNGVTSVDEVTGYKYEMILDENSWYTEPTFAEVVGAEVICGKDSWDNDYCKIEVTITNNGEERLVSPYISFVLRDAEGNMVYTDYGSVYDTAIMPGSTVVKIISVSTDLYKTLVADGHAPATCEAIAYVQ